MVELQESGHQPANGEAGEGAAPAVGIAGGDETLADFVQVVEQRLGDRAGGSDVTVILEELLLDGGVIGGDEEPLAGGGGLLGRFGRGEGRLDRIGV